MASDLRIELVATNVSVEAHDYMGILRFNGQRVWGPETCHEDTVKLAEALKAVDPRFDMEIFPQRGTIENHEYHMSVAVGDQVYLDRLSVPENMTSLQMTVYRCLYEAEGDTQN